MTNSIPNPDNDKYILLYDATGAGAYQIPAPVNSDGQVVLDGVSVDGLQLTTSGVSDSLNKRFVTDAELADLALLQPLAASEAALASLAAVSTVLAGIGALTGAETLLASTPTVNLNTATPTTIYTCATGKSAVITRFVLRLASTSLTTVSLSIGWNSAAFDDVLANATHTELTGNTLYTVLVPKTGAKIGTTTQLLKLLCNTLQGGAATCTVEVFGYLF